MYNKPTIYLDYNATAPLRPEIFQAMQDVMGEALNPSSVHSSGRKARKLVEDARQKILRRVNGESLIFCGSGTEANNLAVIQMPNVRSQMSEIAISSIEHDSVFKSAQTPKFVRVDKNGVIDLNHLEEILTSGICHLVSIMLANNETGVIQPIQQAAEIAHKHGALLHTDAVQAFGKIDIDFKNLGVDMMTISSHKIGGPIGTAALIHKSSLEIKPIMFGGGQEKNKRPGTENVPAIIGFGEVAKNVSRETFKLRDYLENKIRSIAPDAIIYGEAAERLPNTTCIAMPDIEAATQLIHFDTNGICVSSGSACSSGKVEVSRVLKAMNVPLAKNALRISTGWATTQEDIDLFIKHWRELYLRSKNAAA